MLIFKAITYTNTHHNYYHQQHVYLYNLLTDQLH